MKRLEPWLEDQQFYIKISAYRKYHLLISPSYNFFTSKNLPMLYFPFKTNFCTMYIKNNALVV